MYISTIDNTVHTLHRHSCPPSCCAEVTEAHMYWLISVRRIKTARVQMSVFNGFVRWITGTDLLADMTVLWNRPVADRCFISADDFRVMYRIGDMIDRAILLLGGLMGIRRSEMISITPSDVREDSILVHGKGHGDGLVVPQPMPEVVRDFLEDFQAWKAKRGYRMDRIIPIDNVWGISYRISKLGDLIGIRATPHSLRRLYATTLYDRGNGADLITVRDLMRHAKLETTITCYIAADPTVAHEAVEMCGDKLTAGLYI